MTEQPAAVSRPLLLNGEALARPIQRASTFPSEKYHPQSLEEARANLGPMVSNLRSLAASTPTAYRADSLIFQATLLPNYLAASYFPSELLDFVGLRSLGSRASRGTRRTEKQTHENVVTKSLILAGPDAALERLEALLTQQRLPTSARTALDTTVQFSDFRLATPDEVVRVPEDGVPTGPEGLLNFEAVLHPDPEGALSGLHQLSDTLLERWYTWVEVNGGRAWDQYRTAVNGLTFVPVSLAPAAAAQAFEFNLLRSIRPMPEIDEIWGDDDMFREVSPPVDIPAPVAAPKDAVRIAIFDGGVDVTSPFFAHRVIETDLTGNPGQLAKQSHGSAVTGACLYGEISSAAAALTAAPVLIDHYRIAPKTVDDPDASWLLKQIETVAERGDHKIIHLSLGPKYSVEDHVEPHSWTSTLDRLAYEHDVLFVVAAGNNGQKDASLGLNRVQVPADMVNGIGVGACDSPSELEWARSTYSAVGPGRAGARVQPTGLAFGGSDAVAFQGLMGDGTLVGRQGTSFAAPIVTHSIAEVAHALGSTRSGVATLRCFAAHGARQHEASPSYEEHGFGRLPADLTELLECAENSATVLFQGRIKRGQLVSLTLPVPAGIVKGDVKMTWTLSIKSPTQATEALEYTRASVETTFRPHEDRYSYSRGDKSYVVNQVVDAVRASQLLAAGFVPSMHPTSDSGGSWHADEATLRQSGKWETIRKKSVGKRASSLKSPRLDLEYMARQGGLLESAANAPDIDYALLFTVTMKPGTNVYESVRQQFGVLQQLRTTTRLRV
jgi:hypothetical protein